MNNVHIANPRLLDQKIDKIKKDDNSRFHVISDFDRTLTPAFVDSTKPSTSFAQIREGGYLSGEYLKEARALFDQYRPIEISEEIPLEEKKKLMTEWFEKHLRLMVDYGLTRNIIEDIIRKKKFVLRKGVDKFIDILHEYKIPLLVFSAGVGDLIKTILENQNRMYINTHIISNFFEFDEKGVAKGFTKPVVHPFNKNEGQVVSSPYYSQIKQRRNVLLLGDMPSDLDMLEGMTHDTIIKIGFLNENAEKLLPEYSKIFDAVILNDSSMEFVNDILKKML